MINIFLLGASLSLNRSKTSLIDINLNSGDLAPYTKSLRCSVDSLPFNYLGFSIGGVVIEKRCGTPLKSDSDKKSIGGGMCPSPNKVG